jgi:hypothetical protein
MTQRPGFRLDKTTMNCSDARQQAKFGLKSLSHLEDFSVSHPDIAEGIELPLYEIGVVQYLHISHE